MIRLQWLRRVLPGAGLAALLAAGACAPRAAVRSPEPSPGDVAPGRASSAGDSAAVRARADSARAALARLGAKLPSDLRKRTWSMVVKSVRAGYFDPSFAGINWDSIVRVYKPRVLGAQYSEPFHEQLSQMLSAMRVSHTVVISPERLEAERTRDPGWTGAEARALPEGWVVARVVPGSPADSAGLRPGDVVDSISGLSAQRIGRAGTRAWLTPMDALRGTTGAVNSWLAGNRGAVVRVSVLDAAGRRRSLRMTSAAFPGPSVRIGNLPPVRAYLETRRLAGGVGYLRFSSFVPGLETSIRDAIRDMHDAPGLILDLRGNPGGYDELGDHIASMLVAEPHLLTKTLTRRGVRYDQATPVDDGYRGPVVVLLDGLSASASEQFAAPMQELGRIRVVGERSAGADLEASVVALPTGGALMFPSGQPRTAAGRVIEGVGVTPDLPVALSRASLAAGHDAQLDAAVAEARRLAAAQPSPGAGPAAAQAPAPLTPPR